MGEKAVETLRELWKDLTFHKVARVIAKDPEDILHIEVQRDTGHTDYYVKSKLIKDIPEEDRQRARVVWHHYFGFTEDNVYFLNKDYWGLDVDVNLTLDFSTWENHKHGWSKTPNPGDTVVGEVIDTPKGKRFKRWFLARPEVELFMKSCLAGKTDLSDDELGRRLVTPGFPDQYWALARLILNDNVQAFVDQLREVPWGKAYTEFDTRPVHPAHGLPTGSVSSTGEQLLVDHRGMWISPNMSQFVHELGYQLNEPEWYETFKRLAKEQVLGHGHPALGGWCNACHAEREERDKTERPWAHWEDD